MRKPITNLTLLIILFCLSSVYGADWTRWRGPNGDGTSQETNWNPKALAEEIRIAWYADVGMGHSSTAVKDNYLYTLGNKKTISEGDTTTVDIVYCLNSQTGSEIWRYAYPCKEGLDPGPGSTPVLDGNRLYTLSREGHLFCFNAKDGRIIWMRNILSDSLTTATNWGLSCSPLIVDDLLILNANKSGLVLDKKTGKVVRTSERENAWFSSAVCYDLNGKKRVVISSRDSLHAVDYKTGKVDWSLSWRNSCSDPIIRGTRMLLTGNDVVLFDISGDMPQKIWENKDVSVSFQSWVVSGDNAYGFGWERPKEPLTCINMNTGETRWEKDVGNMGSVIAVKSHIIVLTRSGRLIVVKDNPETYEEIASAQIVPMADNTGINNRRQCHCWINPVLSNGKIYARNTYGNLVCVDVGQSTNQP
jgi:outer membrane protein assembly factor BamB